jgi:hypothetical protein
MSCVQQRDVLKAKGIANQNVLNLTYRGFAPVNIRGPVTKQLYQFSHQHPVRSVDARDAVFILKMRLFRHAR